MIAQSEEKCKLLEQEVNARIKIIRNFESWNNSEEYFWSWAQQCITPDMFEQCSRKRLIEPLFISLKYAKNITIHIFSDKCNLSGEKITRSKQFCTQNSLNRSVKNSLKGSVYCMFFLRMSTDE